MSVARRIALFLAAVVLVAMVLPSTAGAAHGKAPEVSPLASFGSDLGSGSAIGPDGALYVTDGNAGSVLRIDRHTGRGDHLRHGVADAGDRDRRRHGRRVHRPAPPTSLVTLVSGDIVGRVPSATPATLSGSTASSATAASPCSPTSARGRSTTRRRRRSSSRRACSTRCSGTGAGSWSPTAITTGCCGSIGTARSAPSSRWPTSCRPGLERIGKRVLFTELGPVPHHRRTARSSSSIPGPERPESWPAGRAWSLDVERGPGGKLYALSQGQWDGVEEGSPALPNTGRLVIVQRDGSLKPVVDGSGADSSSIARRRWRSSATPPTSCRSPAPWCASTISESTTAPRSHHRRVGRTADRRESRSKARPALALSERGPWLW